MKLFPFRVVCRLIPEQLFESLSVLGLMFETLCMKLTFDFVPKH